MAHRSLEAFADRTPGVSGADIRMLKVFKLKPLVRGLSVPAE